MASAFDINSAFGNDTVEFGKIRFHSRFSKHLGQSHLHRGDGFAFVLAIAGSVDNVVDFLQIIVDKALVHFCDLKQQFLNEVLEYDPFLLSPEKRFVGIRCQITDQFLARRILPFNAGNQLRRIVRQGWHPTLPLLYRWNYGATLPWR
jgi:hypothetical protein